MLTIRLVTIVCLFRGGFCQTREPCSSISSVWGTCTEPAVCKTRLGSEANTCKAGLKCCHNLNTSELSYAPNCGQPALLNRIVGGEVAILGEQPWTVALEFVNDSNPEERGWTCDGTLITRRHVLTAAHCLQTGLSLEKIRLGSTVLKGENEDGSSAVEVQPEAFVAHEKYDAALFRHDIAMIVLKNPVNYTEAIKPICLPLEESVRRKDLENLGEQKAVVSGFGYTLIPDEYDERVLRKVRLPIVKNQTCVERFKKATHYRVHPEWQLCAGIDEGGKDACYGDSGGPLILSFSGYYYLMGIVSEGYKCALPLFPGIYTRVTSYLDWIIEHM